MALKPAGSRRPSFHPLVVDDVHRLTPDAVALDLWVPPELGRVFAFVPGQHVTVRHTADGVENRRSYSIATTRADADRLGVLRIGVGRVAGGAVSGWLVDDVRPGDVLDVLPPTGELRAADVPGGHHVAVAAGSGITPVWSIVLSLLDADPRARATIVLANRTAASTMFRDELDARAAASGGRLRVLHALSREDGASPLLTGRLDEARLAAVLDDVAAAAGTPDAYYLVGPSGLVDTARRVLAARGVPEDAVHEEVFHTDAV